MIEVYSWLSEESRSEESTSGNHKWQVHGPGAAGRQFNYFFEECSSESIDYNGKFGKGIDSIYTAMTRCDNIRSLSISIHQQGCVIESIIDSFDWKVGDKFSQLDELKLSGYGWVNERRFLSERPRPRSTIAWKEVMDWSKLRKLDIDRPPDEFLEAFRGHLTGLESFKIRPRLGFWGSENTFCSFCQNSTELRQNYTAFIKDLPPLRELSISGMGELLNVTDLLQRHGQTMENLTIHEFERDCRPCGNTTWGRPTLSIDELQSINDLAPNLKSLELDIYRRWDWPHRIFNVLSQFQNLESLTLWFDLEDPYEQTKPKLCYRQQNCVMNVPMEPFLDKKTALMIFRELKAAQQSQKLTSVILYTGDVNRRRGSGYGMGPQFREEYFPTKFECRTLNKTMECSKFSIDEELEGW